MIERQRHCIDQSTLDAKCENILNQISYLSEKFEKHEEDDKGNFQKIHDGLDKILAKVDAHTLDCVLKVDRLEQSELKRSWLLKTAVGVALSSLVTTLWGHFK